MIECIGCPGFYEATQFKTWGGWTFHVTQRPLHDITGVQFRWDPGHGHPEPIPVEITVSGGAHHGVDRADAAPGGRPGGGPGGRPGGGPGGGVPRTHKHVPTPGERRQPKISDDDRALLREAELSELEDLTRDR